MFSRSRHDAALGSARGRRGMPVRRPASVEDPAPPATPGLRRSNNQRAGRRRSRGSIRRLTGRPAWAMKGPRLRMRPRRAPKAPPGETRGYLATPPGARLLRHQAGGKHGPPRTERAQGRPRRPADIDQRQLRDNVSSPAPCSKRRRTYRQQASRAAHGPVRCPAWQGRRSAHW